MLPENTTPGVDNNRPELPLRRNFPWAASHSDVIVALLALIWAGTICFGSAQLAIRAWNVDISPSWISVPNQPADPDTVLIHGGLVAAPRFIDTLRWWSGTWVGQVPFYRPLSSLIFWLEWKISADHEQRFTVFAVLFHLLAVYQFVRLGSALFRHFRCPWPSLAAAISAIVFVDGLYILPERQQTNFLIYAWWKNQPDSLCTLFFCLSLRLYITALTPAGLTASGTEPDNALTSGLPGDSGPAGDWSKNSHLRSSRVLRAAALGCYLASCLCKEAGVYLPLLLFWLEWPGLSLRQRRDRATCRVAWRRILPFLLVLMAFMALRAVFLKGTIGFRYGTNHAWSFRLTQGVFGPVMQVVAVSDYLALLLGLACFGLLMYGRWRMSQHRLAFSMVRGLCGLLILSVLLVAVGAIIVPFQDSMTFWDRPVVAAFMMTQPAHMIRAFQICLFLLAFVSGLICRPRLTLFSYSWVVLGLALTLLSPSPLHRYYLLEGGYALIMGYGILFWLLMPPRYSQPLTRLLQRSRGPATAQL